MFLLIKGQRTERPTWSTQYSFTECKLCTTIWVSLEFFYNTIGITEQGYTVFRKLGFGPNYST